MLTPLTFWTKFKKTLKKFINLRLLGITLILKVLILYFLYMPPISILLFLIAASVIGYSIIKGLANIRSVKGIYYLTTTVVLVFIMFTPPPWLNNKLIVFRYWLELVPRQAKFEAQIANMPSDNIGVKHAHWLLSSWGTDQVYIVYNDAKDRPIDILLPNDACFEHMSKLSGNFYILHEGCDY